MAQRNFLQGRQGKSFFLKMFFLCILGGAIAVSSARPAAAFCAGCAPGDVPIAVQTITRFHQIYEEVMMRWITNEFQMQRDWLTTEFFKNQVLPALMLFTEQMSAVAMEQVFMIGSFMDAKTQLETQRLLQELQYQAHRDYQPSDDFCYFGTNVRSLGASGERGRYNALALGARQMQRQLGTEGVAGAEKGPPGDKLARWQQFVKVYCDPNDNNKIDGRPDTGLEKVCASGTGERSNNDIDYTRMIDDARTLNVGFDDEENSTADEQDVFAMSSNLYGNDVLTRKLDNEDLGKKTHQAPYLALRSIAAKRSVAENSFSAIVGLKSAGTENMAGESKTRDFLGAVMKELGVPDDEVFELIGENPSYYAQLEILAKKIYQNPDFFADLYDTPANVERKSVALKAIELMLDRAIFESQIRQEMATSVLLSTRLAPQFEKINGKLAGGEKK